MKTKPKTLGQIAYEQIWRTLKHHSNWSQINKEIQRAYQSAAEKVVKESNRRKRKRLNDRAKNISPQLRRLMFQKALQIISNANTKKGQSK